MQNSYLENQLIKLRALEPDDINLLFEWENNCENWLISSTLAPFSKAILEQYISHAHEDIYTAKQLRLVIVDKNSGKAIGLIDIFDFDPQNKRAGIGILIDPLQRGTGIGFLALEQIKVYCSQVLHLHQIYANILSNNSASFALFKKCGFEPCGIKKDWVRTAYNWIDEHSLQFIFR